VQADDGAAGECCLELLRAAGIDRTRLDRPYARQAQELEKRAAADVDDVPALDDEVPRPTADSWQVGNCGTIAAGQEGCYRNEQSSGPALPVAGRLSLAMRPDLHYSAASGTTSPPSSRLARTMS
jgi:hypothetical protein